MKNKEKTPVPHEMTRGEYMKMLDKFAVEYCKQNVEESIHRNNHMNDLEENDDVTKRVSDAIIVDFVNFVGSKFCLDYGMYTKDLIEKDNIPTSFFKGLRECDNMKG
jgi:hypothetical protein